MALADFIYQKPVIETDRLILRPMVSSDVPALKEWMPDKTIYKYFLDKKQPNNNIKLEAQDVKSSFDLLQTTDTSKDIIEIKVRHKYTFEQFDDISIDTYKIRNILTNQDELGCTNSYVVAIYPKSDKIVLIDITYIDVEEEDIVNREANHYTISDNPYKKPKQFVALNIKNKKDNHLHTRAYQYTFPNLMKTYIDTFKKYSKKYNIPDDIVKMSMKGLYS